MARACDGQFRQAEERNRMVVELDLSLAHHLSSNARVSGSLQWIGGRKLSKE